MSTQIEIAKICDEIKNLLLEKNSKYGDSALNPCRIFSKSNAVEQILIRIDDKISRIQKGAGLLGSDEDVINDLIGYLILLKIAQKRQASLPPVTFFPGLSNDIISITDPSASLFQSPWDGSDIDNPNDAYDHFKIACPD